MGDNLTSAYHRKWVNDKSKQNPLWQSQRVLNTIRRYARDILKREFAGRLLDIGCGDGSFVRCCCQAGMDAVGIDIKDGINFERDKLPYKQGEFDIVFMYSVIEHINDPSNLLNEIRRVLVKNGLVIIITSNINQAKFDFYADPTHVRPYNPKSISWLMNIFKFQRLHVGLWTVNKATWLWKLPEGMQFAYGILLPFSGMNQRAPSFLKGKSKAMICAFSSPKDI